MGERSANPMRYPELVGALVYFIISYPDIVYVINISNQPVQAPTFVHYPVLLLIIRYLPGTITRALFFQSSSIIVTLYIL